MKMKSIRAIVLACVAASVSFAQGGRIWHAAPGGLASQDGSSIDHPTTFSNALAKASAGDQVLLAEGEYPIATTVLLDKGVTVTGAGIDKTVFVRQAKTNARFFLLNHPAAVLEKATLRGASNGNSDAYGNAVLIDKEGGTMRDCRVSDCVSSGSFIRGTIAILGAQGLVDRCLVHDNQNSSNGTCGGVYLEAGRLENSLIYGNSCRWHGGGVYCKGGYVRNCTIVDNLSNQKQGGGLFWDGGGAAGICLQNLIVTGNRAPLDNGPGTPD